MTRTETHHQPDHQNLIHKVGQLELETDHNSGQSRVFQWGYSIELRNNETLVWSYQHTTGNYLLVWRIAGPATETEFSNWLHRTMSAKV